MSTCCECSLLGMEYSAKYLSRKASRIYTGVLSFLAAGTTTLAVQIPRPRLSCENQAQHYREFFHGAIKYQLQVLSPTQRF